MHRSPAYKKPRDVGEEMLPCPYNINHVVPSSTRTFHIRHCPDREKGNQCLALTEEDAKDDHVPRGEDWEPEIVAGCPGYVPGLSNVRPFFKEMHGMPPLQRRRYYDELLNQRKGSHIQQNPVTQLQTSFTRKPRNANREKDCPSNHGAWTSTAGTSDGQRETNSIEPKFTRSSSAEPSPASNERQPTTLPRHFGKPSAKNPVETNAEAVTTSTAERVDHSESRREHTSVFSTGARGLTTARKGTPLETPSTPPSPFALAKNVPWVRAIDADGQLYFHAGRGRGQPRI